MATNGPTNMERAFETHAEVLAAWVQLNTAIKSRMDLRRYELATVAAAQRLRSSYCSLAHGKVLRDDCGVRSDELGQLLGESDELIAIFVTMSKKVKQRLNSTK